MNPKKEIKKETLGEMMERFDVVFSMRTSSGFANVVFDKEYTGKIEMKVRFFDDEGNSLQDECGDGGVPIEEFEKVAKFIQTIKEMRLPEYQK